MNNTKDIVRFFAETLEEKKAEDVIILDIRKISFIADYFIICTAQSPAHLKTLSNTILKELKEKEINRNLKFEGNPQTGWILLDCGDIVIHLFSKEKREYYHLEYIWQEAEKVSL
ncbi:MAG: ribosome silencing factor [Candidatus Caldatribacteriota bacterium]|nr:ribosome silencing factor [Atribacterota bacterium]MDD3030859.1 ribosome silencing factor [Atribacterota bacterium]MDD3640319.1 ribosome silencing factor [Atribacterota bacterium]MDD4288172.1 ribosome silencing factor [Atribacterota bacterium]MDD4764902.1 ribosome silencing factor [Atribacterota bacterium]